jgi:signal transduction histidine kinase
VLFCTGGDIFAEAPLTTCAAIRALPRESAARGLPVQLRAVVTFTYGNKDAGTVVENGGEGIYMDAQSARTNGLLPADEPWPENLVRGALVEVNGVTGPGHFAPVIFPRSIRVIGTAPLSEPPLVPFFALLDGRWDCQRVRLRGVVQFAEEHPTEVDRVRLDLAALGGRIPINSLEAIPNLPRLMDAEVEVTGIVFTYFNIRGEFVGAWMQMAQAGDLRVLQPGPEDPFAVPELRLSTLRPFSREGMTFHRRRCTGTVTLSRPGEFFYLQEGERGVRVETRDATLLAPGDRVEVSGFVEVAEQFGKLRGALVRKIGEAARPVPVPAERRRVLGEKTPRTVSDAEDMDGRFASLRGRLEKVDGPRLLVESEGRLVSAMLVREPTAVELARFVPGSEVRVDGVIQVELSSGWPAQDFLRPVNFQLFVHSPEDVMILRAAPWWTPRRLWLLLGGIGVVLAVMLGWNWLLRRRVEQRGVQLAQEIRARREAAVEFEATLRERERLAADLHDTLEQSLTGVAFRLETMVLKREKAQDYSVELDRVRQLFASTREDVRRSIWNLRANSLEGHTLPEAIQSVADRLAGGRDLVVAVETEGAVRALPDFIAGNLLLLAVEAMTNALKHAEPRSILVRVAFAADAVTLTVEDDGHGFDPAHAAGPREGHFGLQGMRERVKRLDGVLEVTTAPGKGTRLAATVPVRKFDATLAAR